MLIRIVTTILITAGVCSAGPVSGAWEISLGAHYVRTFDAEFIPESSFYPSFSVKDRPHEILVFPGRTDHPLDLNTKWKPRGKPLGIYAFLLHLKSGAVELMPLEQFLKQKIVKEDLKRKFGSKYPKLECRGKDTGHAMVNMRNGRAFIAVGSGNSRARKKTSFGIPSIIPFMGRQKFIETRTYHSGTLFLEVFDVQRSRKPIVRFQQDFREAMDPPVYFTTAAWVQGAEKPLLVFVDNGAGKGKTPRIFLVDCLHTDTELRRH